jgi:diguanylate cyclase (GGDEF)-like protein
VTALDPATIILMSTLMGGAMSVVLFSAHRSFPVEIRGLGHWALGLLLMVGAAVSFSLRGGVLPSFVPDAVPRMVANGLLLWGLALSMIGTQVFYGQRPAWWLLHLLWVAGMAANGYWLVISPDFSARVATFSFVALVIYGSQVALIARHGERHFSTWFFGLLMLLQALVLLSRGVMALSGDVGPASLLHPGPFRSAYLATGNFMALMLTVGFMAVATRRLQTILELRSIQDPLTQVLNRRGFADVYARERALMRRNGGYMTLLSIDLDFFKAINDRHGHATGDRVLVHVAAAIGTALRITDHVARFGGEEFVVLLPATGVERAIAVAERIQAMLREPRVEGEAVPAYTVSIGVCCQLSADEDLDDILVCADQALYRAKANGRDRIEVAEMAVAPLLARRA